ncbi:hypothetical protein pipiens_009274 [Culex pipiens pipiens]|uniref:40S ribosomal protein S2 n=1 Tax=Culex pipiens pipiens TaxID=38569 RepID=A0ABD1DEC3_CULPP
MASTANGAVLSCTVKEKEGVASTTWNARKIPGLQKTTGRHVSQQVRLLLSGVLLFPDKKPTILRRKQFRNGQIFKDLVLAVVPVRGASRGGRERGRGRGKEDSKEWVPVTELVRDGKIRTLEEIYLYSLPILNRSLKDECAEDHARPKADSCRKEVATAIRGAIILAKLSVMPVRRGYWGNKIGKPHTVLCKVFGKCGYRPSAPQSGSHCSGPGPEEAAADGRYRGLRRSRETRNPGHQLHQSLRRFFRHVTLTVIQ